MAIQIYDKEEFEYFVIPYFFGGDLEKPNPHLQSFKMIYSMTIGDYISDEAISQNLQTTSKAWTTISHFYINEDKIARLKECSSSTFQNLKIDHFTIGMNSYHEISTYVIDVLSEVKPKNLVLYFQKPLNDLKPLFSLDIKNIKITNNLLLKDSIARLIFLNSQVLIRNFSSDTSR